MTDKIKSSFYLEPKLIKEMKREAVELEVGFPSEFVKLLWRVYKNNKLDEKRFWNLLTEENKKLVEKKLADYAGSDGPKGRIFELYQEGAWAIGEIPETYMDPNKYIKLYFEEV